MKKNNLIMASFVMLVFSIISKLSGFAREIVFAHFYGSSNLTDAYIIATTISTTIFSGIAVAVSTGYIPTISAVSKEKVSKITSNIINIVSVLIILVSILGIVFIEQIIPFFAVGFTEETRLLTVNMARIILPSSFLYVIYNILNGYMQFRGVFFTVGVATVIYNFINMVTFGISYGNTDILAIGYVFSWVISAVFLLIMAFRNKFSYKFTLNPNDEVIKSIVKLGIPIFLGQFIFQFNSLVDRNFASVIGEGVLTNMKYANQLILFVVTIFVISIVTALYPTLSKLANDKNFEEYKKISTTSMKTILLFVLPVTVAFIMLSTQITEFAFLRGEFTESDAKITSEILMFYAIGLPAISLNEVLNKQFYSLKDTKTPVLSNMVSLLVNIVFNFIFVTYLKHIGLAFATSLANTVLALILYYRLQRKIGNLGTKLLVKSIIKMLISSAVMGVFVYFTVYFLTPYTGDLGNTGNLIEIFASAAVGATVYFVFAYILKIEELNIAIDYAKGKILKKKA